MQVIHRVAPADRWKALRTLQLPVSRYAVSPLPVFYPG